MNARDSVNESQNDYRPRFQVETSGFELANQLIAAWSPAATLEEIGDAWRGVGTRAVEKLDKLLAESPNMSLKKRCETLWMKATLLNYEGDAKTAYCVLEEARSLIQKDETLSRDFLYSTIYFQGVAALRRGENENCIMCRGESSCILPISSATMPSSPGDLVWQFVTSRNT